MQEIKVGDRLEWDFSDKDASLIVRGTVEKIVNASVHMNKLETVAGHWHGDELQFGLGYIKEYGHKITNLSKKPSLINVLRQAKRKGLTNTK